MTALRAALLVAVGCGGRPPAAPEATPPRVTAPPADGAPPIDAAPPAPDAPPLPTMSAEEEEALGDALAGLNDEHKERYWPAMRWLERHPDVSRPALIRLVEAYAGAGDMDGYRAALVLGRIGHPDDVPLLERGLYEADSEHTKWTFVKALVAHADPSVTRVFITATGSDDPALVGVAASGLGLRKDEDGRDTLEGLLDHDDAGVRYKAVLALIDLGARPSRAALKARRKIERDDDVRGAIRKALR